MSICLKSVIPVPVGDCRLEQPSEKIAKGDTPTQLRATYIVRHTGDREGFTTYVYNDLTLDVQVPGRVREPMCKATMLIETPWLDFPGAAIDKMAEWLERLARGMRDGTGHDGFGINLVASSPPPAHVREQHDDEEA